MSTPGDAVDLADTVAEAESFARYLNTLWKAMHTSPYEKIQERAGLSVTEVIGLLADYAERLGGKPTEPRTP